MKKLNFKFRAIAAFIILLVAVTPFAMTMCCDSLLVSWAGIIYGAVAVHCIKFIPAWVIDSLHTVVEGTIFDPFDEEDKEEEK